MREYSIGTIKGLEPILPSNLAKKLAEIDAPISFVKNSQIYYQGDEADHVFFLLHGRVKSTLIGSSGQESILRIHLPHSILGLTALASHPIRDASATCLDPVTVVSIKRPQFLDIMRSEPDFGTHVVRLLTDRMSDFHHRVGDWLAQSVEQRLSQTLLALSAPDPNGGNPYVREIPLTHEELAQMINARRPTVSSALSRLAGLGIVKKTGRRLMIANRDLLARHVTDTFSE
ncbi:MAG: Crp/Fnr family transcriptional regulator [Proteobacteria bacterium]|nr:Crp/Fnr family transcriptional regulator [Pseudomonadota bacterium]